MSSRVAKLKLNTFTSLALQLTSLVCGFILPRLILSSFGSEVNGLVNSIAQFLGFISLLDLGVGAVVQSSLYKPLANKNIDEISKIYKSADKFFKRLAYILVAYVVVLLIVYPTIIKHDFSYIYVVSLISAISISLFAQYYFGIVNSILLSADQKGYIQYTAQIITLILNTMTCALLIRIGCSIQIVKLTTSIIYIARPLYLSWYVKKNYHINKRITYLDEPIKQKWSGMAQHFAAYIILGTDNVILTLFSTLSNVSIYSVYHLIISGINNIFYSITNGFQSILGDMIAKKEVQKLKDFFSLMEWGFHTGITIMFGCTGMLILQFVQVYTKGINDANYYQPVFALLISLAYASHCMRLPYHILIKAAGHYKETQYTYIISTALNIFISISTVKIFGLIGVSIGTLVAMIYQTVSMAWYNSKNIIQLSFGIFAKQCVVDIVIAIVSYFLAFQIPFYSITYGSWCIKAVLTLACWICSSFVINFLLCKDKINVLTERILRK